MRTIVGERPRSDGGGGRAFSRGVQVLLLKASVDPEFQDLLAGDWRAAAGSIGLDLARAERAILESVPGAAMYLHGSEYPFESEDAVPEPGDGDPREVNEPPKVR